MPIYAYRCTACGHVKDVLQKMSDTVLTVCPACGASSFTKQLTAAGFQLKGSGWYVTDFRGGNAAAPKVAEGAEAVAAGTDQTATDKPADKTSEKTAEKAADKTGDKAATKVTPAPAPTPAAAPSSTGTGAGT